MHIIWVVMNNPYSTPLSVRSILKAARGPQSQTNFASKFGKGQDVWSKYETGKANPPMTVIDECMQILHTQSVNDPLYGYTTSRIEDGLSEVRDIRLKAALACIVEHIAQTS